MVDTGAIIHTPDICSINLIIEHPGKLLDIFVEAGT